MDDYAQKLFTELGEGIDKLQQQRDDLLEACKDGDSYEKGDFADGLLELGDKLGKLDEVGIAANKIWLLSKAEQIKAAISKAESVEV